MKSDLRLSSIKITGLLLGFLIQVFFTKLIGAAAYGAYVLFVTWTTFLSTILILGYDRLILKQLSFFYIQKNKESFRAVLDKLLIYVFINSVLFLILAFIIPHKFLSNTIFSKEVSRDTWILISMGTIVVTLFELHGKILSAMQRVEVNFIRSEIVYKFVLFFSVLLLFFGKGSFAGVNMIIVGVLLAYIVTLLFFLLYFDRKKILEYFQIKKVKISIGKENYVFFFTSLNYYAIAQMDKLVIGKYESLQTLGIYGLVSTLISIVSFSTIVYQKFYPKIYNYIQNNDIVGLETDFKRVSRNSLFIALPFIMFTLVFTKDILLFFGPQFTAGVPILRVLIWGQFINFLTGPNGYVLNIGKHSKIDFINSMVIVGLTMTLIIIGYKNFGVIGVAAATSIGLVFVNIIKVIEIKLFYNMFPYELKNILIAVTVFLSFCIIKYINLDIANLIPRLITNFTLSLLTASITVATLYFFIEKRKMHKAALYAIYSFRKEK